MIRFSRLVVVLSMALLLTPATCSPGAGGVGECAAAVAACVVVAGSHARRPAGPPP